MNRRREVLAGLQQARSIENDFAPKKLRREYYTGELQEVGEKYHRRYYLCSSHTNSGLMRVFAPIWDHQAPNSLSIS